MDLGLHGQAALITGAGGGIGSAIARRLSDEGCAVALVDLAGIGAARAQAAELDRAGRAAIALEADVTSVAAADQAVSSTLQRFGRLDILVCNAGIARDAMVWKMTEQAWDEVVAVNLKGCFTFCHAAAPVFRARSSGRIVTIASINGLRGKAGLANYSASKAGVIGLTRVLARELGPSGITANCVAPGMIRTGLTADLPPAVLDRAREEAALGRLGEPEDVAAVVAFLCSGPARHVTGEVICVDGGQLL